MSPAVLLEEDLMLPTPVAPPAAMGMGVAGSGSVMAEEAKGLVHVKLWQRTGLAQLDADVLSPNPVWGRTVRGR